MTPFGSSDPKSKRSAISSELEAVSYVSANQHLARMAQPAPRTQPHAIPRAVRFGPFELSMDTGELRKHGVRVRLQHKPFQILTALLERPGRLVTREELRTRLWASDVYVDFESGLNTAVNRLRLALGDSADGPIYIETLARLGYRFLAPVEILFEEAEQAPAIDQNAAAASEPNRSENRPALVVSSDRPRRSRRATLWTAVSVLALLGIAAGLLLHFRHHEAVFQQLTFRKGFVTNARFTPDGKHIAYAAEWNGAPSRLFILSTDGRQSQEVNVTSAWLEATSRSDASDMLIKRTDGDVIRLESASLNGHPSRKVAERARHGDWGPDGKLCLVRAKGSQYTVEYPAGHVIYQSSGWIGDLRVSPDGKLVAFGEHPIPHDDAGQVVMVEAATGQSHVLSPGWESLDGLAWNPSGSEVWFTAAHSGIERSLMAVTLDGRTRLVAQSAGGMQLRDIARSGQVLVNRSNEHMAMLTGNLLEAAQQNISWLDRSRPVRISADGSTILFDESGAGGGSGYSSFVYRQGSQTPERIGAGRAMDLSNDGRWALAQDAADATKLSLISVERRTSQPITGHGFVYRWSKFLPDGEQILSAGNFPGQPSGLYRQRVPDGPQELVTSGLQLDEAVIDQTGRFAAAVSDQCAVTVVDLINGQTRTIETSKMIYPVVFMNARQVLTRSLESKTVVLDILDLNSGGLQPYHRIQPADPTGIAYTFPMQIASNLRTYVYSLLENYSDLFLISGLR